MASVTITDLLMLVALLFVFYFVLNTMLKKKKNKEGFEEESSSKLPVKKDKNCSQASINQNYLDYIFSGVKSIR
jgi:hypothetical protein